MFAQDRRYWEPNNTSYINNNNQTNFCLLRSPSVGDDDDRQTTTNFCVFDKYVARVDLMDLEKSIYG